jgi:hypothetical protein
MLGKGGSWCPAPGREDAASIPSKFKHALDPRFFIQFTQKTSEYSLFRCIMHKVTVGYGNTLSFSPEVIIANVGEEVAFEIYGTNQSIIRGEYTGSPACEGRCNPCVPYDLIHPGQAGFNSVNSSMANSEESVGFIPYAR